MRTMMISDPIVHAVTDANGVESIEMHILLTSKYGSRVLLATHKAIL